MMNDDDDGDDDDDDGDDDDGDDDDGDDDERGNPGAGKHRQGAVYDFSNNVQNNVLATSIPF